ncbi:toll/interleukin-1 receptor domain-containing protein [Bacillus wiedmannii]|uniref:toll/interleukin-1 receptor domain-containing protein n=1 Tax=Bacillus wiedmannii TaxID=1890302 RepID=UPI0021D0EFE2|nr:toll/interleukin-1 receptor domain-containing protein [Bacillus wiedmannii]MCU5684691.1 toll/interleukin-1 receptor domain-containing protein [Bacillus wiedmannii]
MTEIQFTYLYEDHETAEAIAAPLKKRGYKVILRNERLLFGESIEKKRLGLKTADYLVVILSRDALRSNEIKHELSTAMGYYRERKKPIIIPIAFEEEGVPLKNDTVFDDIVYENMLIFRGSMEKIDEFASKFSYRISELIGETQAIEEENKEKIAKVEKKIDTYITGAMTRLTAKERDYRNIAYICYGLCGLFLIAAIIFLLYKVNFIINPQKVLTTAEQIQLGLVGFVLLALILSVARFLYLIGKSFMVESLRNSDRIHAISFGEFYLKAYQEKADWSEIKEAFQHWNIDGGSSFNSQSANDFDPEIFKNIIEFTKVITSKK